MIKITSLNKIYKSKKRKVCHAVKNVNLTLPDAGLVFVLGKSGSGKSTLLNLIGGLDSITSGAIEVDGNDLSTFKEKDFCNYRNTHIGFIFQDYHLIDELTVYENIVLSLNLRRIEDKELVKAALEKVDLAGYEDRYPTELSGGEQQRVAIARAIVKNPRIILADEPTGNLDTHTAKSIVELLKELSKDCLILIVSHNVNDANAYADRIIELAKGKIISDKSRNPDFADCVTLENGELIYPDGLALKDRDIEFINNNLSKFIKRTDKFISTSENTEKSKKIKIDNKNLTLGKELNLSGKFLKNKSLAISLSAFMVAVIMTILALAQTIAAFDGSHIIADEMAKNEQSSLLLNKVVDKETQARLDGNYHVVVGDDDIKAFYDAGYNGKIYPVLNVTVPITEYKNAAGIVTSRYSLALPYLKETLGTMVVDEAFLADKFGEVEYLARLDEFDPAGVIITDYIADSILAISSKYTGKGYEDILGDFRKNDWSMANSTINAVIYTGYKEKYSDLLESIENGELNDRADLLSNERYISFTQDIYQGLGFSYSLNPDFAEDYKDKWAWYVVYTQNLLANGIPMEETRHFAVWGETPDNNLRDSWHYTITPPVVPKGAKYMRVSFGVTGKEFDVNENPLYQLFALENAVLVFSDGSSPSHEQMNYVNGVWLGPNGTEDHYGASWPKSQLSDYIEIPEGCYIKDFATYVSSGYSFCSFYDENKNFISSYTTGNRVPLANGTIVMNVTEYNRVFGTDYDSSNLNSFVPHTIEMSQHRLYDVDFKEPLFKTQVLISGISNSVTYLGNDIAALIAESSVYVNALYFDGTDGIGEILDLTDELNYEPQSYTVEGIHTMTRAVDVFVPIFEFISIFLYIGVIFILMNFASKMINDKMHEIGILKALGTKNGSIGVLFGLQVMLIAILTCGLSTLGYYLFIDVANDILIESIRRIAPSWTMLDLQFLTFKPEIALMNCVLIFALALVSLIFPMIKIKAIKPVKIIKAKE